MKIKIIVQASSRLDRLRGKWGLSILVGEDVLFDTFSDPKALASRMRKANVDVAAIRHVVISHDHWDHTGGLWWLLEQNKNCRVYVCQNSGNSLKKKIRSSGAKLVEVTGTLNIRDNVTSTGEIKGSYDGKPMYEQSLVVNQDGKLAVLTGCSHPGILSILERVKTTIPGQIDLVMGGFHLPIATDEELGDIARIFDGVYRVNSIAPFHCTGNNAVQYFSECMPEQYVKAGTGDRFSFSFDMGTWRRQ